MSAECNCEECQLDRDRKDSVDIALEAALIPNIKRWMEQAEEALRLEFPPEYYDRVEAAVKVITGKVTV